MNVALTTLSLGENYTKGYTLRLIEDVLKLSDLDIYIVTDHYNIIAENFNNSRVHIKEINRNDIVISLPLGEQKAARDFNFNLKYLTLEYTANLNDTAIIFTDCDNSFDWWDKNEVNEFLENKYKEGFDFFAPRTDYKLKSAFINFNNNCKTNPYKEDMSMVDCSILWQKFYNYDLISKDTNYKIIDPELHPWGDAGIPSEYIFIMINNNNKVSKMATQWKQFHDYLVNKPWVFGTWAEGFEIGVSAYLAGFNSYDITYCHPIWNKAITPSGYKQGPRAGVWYETEK